MQLGTTIRLNIEEEQNFTADDSNWECFYDDETEETILMVDKAEYKFSCGEDPKKVSSIGRNLWILETSDSYFFARLNNQKLSLLNFQNFSIDEKGLYYFKKSDLTLRFLNFETGKISGFCLKECDEITFFYGYILMHTGDETDVYIDMENPPAHIQTELFSLLSAPVEEIEVLTDYSKLTKVHLKNEVKEMETEFLLSFKSPFINDQLKNGKDLHLDLFSEDLILTNLKTLVYLRSGEIPELCGELILDIFINKITDTNFDWKYSG